MPGTLSERLDLALWRHRAATFVLTDGELRPLEVHVALTRRGACGAYQRLCRELAGQVSDAGGSVQLAVMRFERARVVETTWSGEDGGQAGAGVREPRRPPPHAKPSRRATA